MNNSIAITTLVTVIAAATACTDSEYSETFELDDEITKVALAVDTGDVILRAVENESGAVAEIELSCRSSRPEVDVFVDGTTLHIGLDAGNGASGCEGLFEIVVPAASSAELRTGIGDIEVAGIDGDVEATTFDGNVLLDELEGELEVTAPSGSVVGSALASRESTVTVGAGAVELSYSATPELVDIDITVGDATLSVPPAGYQISADAEAGEIVIDGVDDQPTASNELWLTAGAGDIAVSGN